MIDVATFEGGYNRASSKAARAARRASSFREFTHEAHSRRRPAWRPPRSQVSPRFTRRPPPERRRRLIHYGSFGVRRGGHGPRRSRRATISTASPTAPGKRPRAIPADKANYGAFDVLAGPVAATARAMPSSMPQKSASDIEDRPPPTPTYLDTAAYRGEGASHRSSRGWGGSSRAERQGWLPRACSPRRRAMACAVPFGSWGRARMRRTPTSIQ